MRIKLFLKLLVMAVGVSIFLGASPVFAQQPPIKLGSSMVASNIIGKESAMAMQLAVKQINEAGGLLGRKVEVIIIDDEMKPEKAAAGLERLVNVEKVDIIVGGMASASIMAQIPGLKKYQKVTVWNGVSSYKVEEAMAGDNWFFHNYPWDYQIWEGACQGWKQIQQKYPAVQIKKMFMAYDESPYGTGYFAGAQAAASNFGYELRGGSFKAAEYGGGDYRAVLKQAKEYKPDIFVYVAYEKDVIPLMEQAKEMGFNPPMFTGWPPSWPKDFAANPLSEGLTYYSMWDEAMKNVNKTSKAFCDAFYKEYKQAPTSLIAPFSYTNIMIVAEAIKRAGTLEKAALIKALEATDYLSPVGGRFTFRKSRHINHQIVAQPKLMQYQKGKMVIVWPWEFATAKLIYPFPAKGDASADAKPSSSKAKSKSKSK
jgi:branched-chain amino acid transport system substrate-binding protein